MSEWLITLAGVVLPSLLITVVVRRWLERVPWRIVLLVLALVLAFIARGVFTPDMPVPLDEVVRGYPYRGLFGDVQSKNYLTNDTVKQILPWMQTVREQLAAGRLPLWNPHLFSGYPLLGNGQSAPFSPFFLLTLFVPLPKQMVAMAGVKLFVALLFGFLLIRRERVPDAAALLGSVVFAFAIFNNAFLYYPMTAVTLLLPAAAYGVLLSLRRASAAPIVFVAIVVAALFAGGHPESVVHVVMGVLALVVIEWIAPLWDATRFGWRDLLRAAVASVCGLLISAPAWVPVVEQAFVSLRVLLLHSQGAAPVFPLTTLWAMVNPDGFGNPAHGNWNWIMSYTHVASVYLGLIVTVLLPGALLSRDATLRDRLLVLAALLFFILSMQWTPLGRALYLAPPLSWVAHDRLRFVVCFLAGIVAARTVTRLRIDDMVLGLLASAAVLALGTHVFLKMFGTTLTWISLTGMAGLVLFWIAIFLRRRWAPVLAFVLTTMEMFVFTFDYNAITDRRYYAPRLPIIDVLHQSAAAGPRGPFRILGLDWVFLPNAAAQYGLEDVRGTDPMEWSDYVRFFRVAEVKDESIDVKRIVDPEMVAVDFLNVRYLLTEPGRNLGGKWRRLYSAGDGELYENSGFVPRFFVPRLARRVAPAEWERELARSSDFDEVPLVHGGGLPPVIVNPSEVRLAQKADGPAGFRLHVITPAGTLIASSQPAMPWWTVRVNGRKTSVVRVNGAFLGFFVPAGTSEVVISYSPWSFWSAVAAGAVGLLGLLALTRFSRGPRAEGRGPRGPTRWNRGSGRVVVGSPPERGFDLWG